MNRQTFTLTLQEARMIAPGVRHLAFTRDDGEILAYVPGQFITVHINTDLGLARRSYSIASIPGQSSYIEIAVSYVAGGLATELFANMEVGTTLTASGPFGRLILREEQPKRYFLVATGTGVTPYRAMLPELAQRLNNEPELAVTVLFGTRTREDILYSEDFLEFAKQHPRFNYRACYSRMQPDTDYECQGYVQNIFDEFKPNPENDIFYLCGNPHMIDASFAKLTELGFPSQNVRREKYVSSK
ncbi:MAG: ferredoxin--NADP(+) reductase [Gammaproteobacteria bacterium]|nr:ferredoxin--NADP(+) reductase [Gammaproteobacteria bacterium]